MTRRGRKALDGLADDLRDHIERQTEENLARGMTPDEARRQARLALGNTALIEEDTRAVWVSRWLQDLRRDLRYALRIFRRSPVSLRRLSSPWQSELPPLPGCLAW